MGKDRKVNMSSKPNSKMSKKKIIGLSIVGVLATLLLICGVYVSIYYHADDEAIAAYEVIGDFDIKTLDDKTIIYEPEHPMAGLIFYPGGKVEYTAYEPLMKELAAEGILCALVKMPFNLAIFDVNAADGIKEQYQDIDNWYMGGHSLGGSAAAMHLENNADDYKGLVLLGSYSTVDLSDTKLQILSIYGSEDKVINKDKYNDCLKNMPSSFYEFVIQGGCHAYFGMYGKQDGDGTPTISNGLQIDITVTKIEEFIIR